jgi:hypothetical protein
MADGSLPAGEVKVKFRDTLPFAAAVPDERASESGPDCPKETRAESREAIATISAIWPGVEDIFIESFVTITYILIIERTRTNSTRWQNAFYHCNHEGACFN